MNGLEHLWLIPALPLAGFVLLALVRPMPHRAVAVIGPGTVGASFVIAILAAIEFARRPAEPFTQTLWQWFSVSSFRPTVNLYLDSLSLLMVLVVTGVAFLIHVYSTRFMRDEEGYGRFFAYMNLFVASMLILVLAEDLVLLYLGWEGVGLCSFLLIGFWYRERANVRAAQKAFIVTRIGDTSFMVGLLLLFTQLGTLHIPPLMQAATAQWPGSNLATIAALLLVGGAVGKSAQLPLQTWLPDAMAGPTPVSALIHAATMVTAGVYLIARTHALFDLSPTARAVVAIIGAATLLLAACSALAQRDIKRCLAYSTISQIGYMFLALGVGAYTAGMFHFMTHAFFKSLLFLAAGVVILAMRHQHDMTKMGGLRKSMPVTFWTFLAGASSLAALPLVTAGFYSKDLILLETFAVSPGLWAVGLAGAFITAVYSFRMVFLVFFGSNRTTGVSPVNSSHTEPTGGTPVVQYPTGLAMGIPLAILAGASIVGGFVQTPGSLGDLGLFAGFMGHALPTHAAIIPTAGARIEEIISALVPLLGLAVAWLVYVAKPSLATGMATRWAGLRRFWLGGWGFDWLYQRLVVWPFLGLAKLLRSDLVDRVYRSGAAVTLWVGAGASRTQTGQLRWYAAAIVLGAIVILAIVVLT